MNEMTNIYKNGYLTDLDLIVENDVRISCHKFILASSSTLFLEEFRNNSSLKDFTIESNFSEKVVRAGLHFLYSETLEELEDIDQLLIFSNRYSLKRLHSYLENYLMSQLTTKNVIKLTTAAYKAEAESLKAACTLLMSQNARVIRAQEEFETFDPVIVKELFQHCFT